LSIGLLLELHWDFLKRRSSRRNGAFQGFFLPKQIVLHIQLNKQFQNMVCCRYFKVLKVVWCRLLDFQKDLSCIKFVVWQLFWPLYKKLGAFLQSSGHPVSIQLTTRKSLRK
jgi:hypothetical protein